MEQSEACLLVLMIDHNVMRLHIAVHNALAVTEVERLEQLIDVISNIDVVELGVEGSEVCVVDILENERRRLTLSRRGWLANKETAENIMIKKLKGRSGHTCESRTTSRRATIFGPPAKFCRILISRFIFFFLTGFKTLTTHFW